MILLHRRKLICEKSLMKEKKNNVDLPLAEKSMGRIGDGARLVETGDGSFTVHHPQFEQAFHSYDGAAKEARDLYIRATGFDTRELSQVCVLDVGLGLGYNAAATLELWQERGDFDLTLVSLEFDAELLTSLSSGEAPWFEGWKPETVSLFTQWQKVDRGYALKKERLDWIILEGDAREQDLSPWKFDYIWQDAFSPDVNPGLWNGEWFSKVHSHCNKTAVMATYSVSRATKNALSEGGWKWERVATTTSKRHWLLASTSGI